MTKPELDEQLTKLWVDEETPYISHDDVKRLIIQARIDELEQQSNVTLGILDANKCMKLLSERHIKRSIELNNQIKGDK